MKKEVKDANLLRFVGIQTGLALACAGIIVIVLAVKGYF